VLTGHAPSARPKFIYLIPERLSAHSATIRLRIELAALILAPSSSVRHKAQRPRWKPITASRGEHGRRQPRRVSREPLVDERLDPELVDDLVYEFRGCSAAEIMKAAKELLTAQPLLGLRLKALASIPTLYCYRNARPVGARQRRRVSFFRHGASSRRGRRRCGERPAPLPSCTRVGR